MAYLSRRHFLQGSSACGFAAGLGALSSLGVSKAWAADTAGYKAMVCIFLKGGMDQGDTILPYDQASYNQLGQVREGLFNAYNVTDPGSTRNRANLLRLNANNQTSLGGREYALPPEMAPLHQMFEGGDLAVVGNVGPLVEQTNRTQMENGTAILPKRLFSHNDQQSTWMSLGVEGSRLGWGGRFMDAAMASAPGDNSTFASISTGSNDVFLAGDTTRPFRVTSNGAPQPSLTSRRWYLGYTDADDAARARMREYFGRSDFDETNVYAQDLRSANRRAIENSETMLAARENEGELSTEFANDSLSRQLKSVAETIQIQQYLNVSRQMFYVTTGGFDTHNNQANNIGGLHTRFANAIASFKAAMQEIGHWNDVIVFTASDFGRTVIDNGDGTDHGWGGHHFVAGGQVRGKNIYGTLPAAETESDVFTPSRGRLIPSVSVEQYAATIGGWFGLTGSEMSSALPSLNNFNETDLGFMNTGTI